MDLKKLIIPLLGGGILIACACAIHHRKKHPLPEKPKDGSEEA
jgi:hypothetical protein